MTIDAIGREISGKITDLARMMLEKVDNLAAFQKETRDARDEDYKNIITLLTSIDNKTSDDTANASAAATKNIAATKGPVAVRKSAKYGITASCCKSLIGYLKSIDVNVAGIAKKLGVKTKAGHGTVTTAAAGTIPVVTTGAKHGGAKLTNGGVTGGGIPGGVGAGAGMGAGAAGFLSASTAIIGSLASLSGKLLDALGVDLMDIFKGVIKDSAIFVKNIHMASYETRGFGESTKDIGKEWLEIGNQREMTGFNDAEYQKIIQKEARKGRNLELKYDKSQSAFQKRSIKDQRNMVKTSMHTAFIIGSSVDETAEVFSQWQRNLGLSNVELDVMSSSMKNIARTTGVSGDNLLDAAKASQTIFEELKKTGALTTSSMANVLQSMTLFKKYGVEETGGAILTALSSWKNFLAADPKLSALLTQAGQEAGMMNKIRAGIMTESRKDMEQFNKGFEKIMTGRVRNVLHTLTDLKDLPKLMQQLSLGRAKGYGTAEQQLEKLGDLRQNLEQMGMQPGDIERYFKAQKENISPIEKLTKLQETKKERVTGGLDVTEINESIRETQDTVNKQILNTYREALDKADDVADAMGSTQALMDRDKLGPFNPDVLKKVTEEALSSIQEKGKTLMESGKPISDKLMKSLGETKFKSFDELAAGMTSGDMDKRKEATEAYSNLQKIIDRYEKTNTDPQMMLKDSIEQANSWLRRIVENGIKFADIPFLKNIPFLNQMSLPGINDMSGGQLAAIVGTATAGSVIASALTAWGATKFLKSILFGGGGVKATQAVAGTAGAASKGGIISRVMSMLGGGGAKVAATGGAKVLESGAEVNALLKTVGGTASKGGIISRVTSMFSGLKGIKIPTSIGGFFSGLRNFTKMGPKIPKAGAALALISGALGAIDTENWEKTTGKSLNEMSFAEQGSASGANFASSAIAAISTGAIDWLKDMGVGIADYFDIYVPDWLRDLNLTKTFGLGPDGIVTKGFNLVLSGFSYVGNGIGEGLGTLWGMMKKKTVELNEKIVKMQAEQDAMNVRKAKTPEQVAAKQANLTQVAAGIKELNSNVPMMADEFNKQAQNVLSGIAVQKERRQFEGVEQWTAAIEAIKKRAETTGIPLEKGVQDALAALEKRSAMEFKWFEIRRNLPGEGVQIGQKGVTDKTFDAIARARFEKTYSPEDAKKFYESMNTLNENTSKPGSIYVHDIHIEKLLEEALDAQPEIGEVSYVGTGAFDKNQPIEAMGGAFTERMSAIEGSPIEKAVSPLKTTNKIGKSRAESLSQTNSLSERLFAADQIRQSEMFKSYTSMQSMGIFDPNLGKDAMSNADNTRYQQMMMGNAGFVPGHPAMAGLGAPLGATAESEHLREIIEKKKLSEDAKRTAASMTEKGLFYKDNLKESNIDSVHSLTDLYGLNLNNLPATRSGTVKGDISTNLLTMDDAEHYVARMIEGEKPTGPTALVPGLDAILDYLSEEAADREEKMIRILEQIRDQRLSEIAPAIAGGTMAAPTKSGLQNWSRDQEKGYWREIQHPAYSPSANHTGNEVY